MPTEYTESAYTEYLTSNTPVWLWAAFAFDDMSVIAPVGTLGEPRDFIAREIYSRIQNGA